MLSSVSYISAKINFKCTQCAMNFKIVCCQHARMLWVIMCLLTRC